MPVPRELVPVVGQPLVCLSDEVVEEGFLIGALYEGMVGKLVVVDFGVADKRELGVASRTR